MRFIPFHRLEGRPHVVVDGAALPGTALTLSHWPKSGTPWPLKHDHSTGIVFNWLHFKEPEVQAEAVSNTHFDEDGLCGVWAALNPADALRREALLKDVASAGDFGVFVDPAAFRVASALAAMADPGRSPLPAAVFAPGGAESTGRLYEALLALLPEMLAEPAGFRHLSEAAEASLNATEEALSRGRILHHEAPDADLAVFELGSAQSLETFSPAALHQATLRGAILVVKGRRYRFYYRYESWVQFVSRPVKPRVDLTALARQLTLRERGQGDWIFEGLDQPLCRLELPDQRESSLELDQLEKLLKTALAEGRPAFQPFDPRP